MAQVDVIFPGYVREGGQRVGGTVSLVRDGNATIVIDPGLVPNRSAILDPLIELGVLPELVTDVIFSHHHPDHTLHAALFPMAKFHDYWAIYKGDYWHSRPAEGYRLSPDVRLMETPGHTPQDITTIVETPQGVVAFTHLWWNEDAPPEDPLATSSEGLHAGRERVLAVAEWVVPGHGPMFRVGPKTQR